MDASARAALESVRDFSRRVESISGGAIVVYALPGQSAREIAEAVLQEFRDKAMTQSGDTLIFPSN